VDAELKSATERWFVRQGLPHAIDEYSAAEDVFTRATPFLTGVFFLEVFASFDDRFKGGQQLGAFVAGAAIMVAAVALVNRFRGRRAFALPDDIGVVELALFVFVPAILPTLFSNERGWRFLALVAFGLLAVRASTIEQWTTADLKVLASFDFLGSAIVVTWEHLAVAGFIAAFSSLQFAVSMVTDSAYRDEFYDDVTGKIRRTLAVRALYLDQLDPN